MTTYKVTVDSDATRWYNSKDQLHREDGPAVEYTNDDKAWYINGQRHREDGPAMKATYGEVNLEPLEIWKDPITDNGTKKSAKGLLYVGKKENKYYLEEQVDPNKEQGGWLMTVFNNDKLIKDYTLQEIRNNINKH